MIRSPYLQPGDKIAIVAPAGRIDREKVDIAIDMFKGWGYEVVVGKNIFKDYHVFSATDRERAEDLQWAFDSEDIRAVFCARGGYGCIRIVDQLDYSKFQGNPKWLVGFSDITVLHAKLNTLGIESVHGPMPVKFPDDGSRSEDITALKKILEGTLPEYRYESHRYNRSGVCSGELVGGNLSIVYSLHGIEIEWKKHEKILFIEDLDEDLYHLDRMMQNLKHSGKLERLQGLVVGQMTGMKDSDPSFGSTAYEIIAEAVQDYKFPVVFDFPAGHGSINYPLIMGAIADLEVNEESYSLVFNHKKNFPGIKDILGYKERIDK